LHEEIKFRLRPFPVLTAETKKGELVYANAGTFFNNVSDSLHALRMAFNPW
jgi:hypothetical protein